MDKTSEPTIDLIISGCHKGDRESQKRLYKLISNEMFAICLSYCINSRDAELVLINGFINLFDNIGEYTYDLSFSDWCKAIFITASKDFYENHS